MTLTEIETKFLNELVKDCVIYRLSEEEALEYIKIRFHKISESSYKKRKATILSDESTQVWLNQFTRIGFVQHHKKQVEIIEAIQNDSLRQFYIETTGTNSRDEDKIKSLKYDIRENSKLLTELGLGTPIISAIKSKLEEKNVQAVQTR